MTTPKRLTVALPSSAVVNHPEDNEIDAMSAIRQVLDAVLENDWPARVRVLQASFLRAEWEAQRAEQGNVRDE